jgi:putative transposase
MPNYRRSRHGSTFFFTVVARQRRRILCNAVVRQALRDTLNEIRTIRPFHIDAWVLLPDHLHCIWTLPPGDADYPARWGWIKKEVTQRVNRNAPVKSTDSSSIWQPRYWEHTIRGAADFKAHCDYIHFNPVKHGYVRDPARWRWSTFHGFVTKGLYPQGWGRSEIRFPDRIGSE